MYPRRSCEHKIGNLPDANSRIFAKNSVSVWQTPVFRDHIGAWASGNLSRLILDDFNVFWLFGVFLRRSIKAQTSHFQWNRLCEITNVEQSTQLHSFLVTLQKRDFLQVEMYTSPSQEKYLRWIEVGVAKIEPSEVGETWDMSHLLPKVFFFNFRRLDPRDPDLDSPQIFS